MSGQRHATMVAAATLALTLTPLIGIFDGVGWAFPVLLTIAVIATCGSLMRAAGRGQGLQTIAMCAGLLIVLTAGFGGGTGLLFVIPLPATFEHFGMLANEGIAGIVTNTPPVPAEGGILFLTLLGIGLVAILHDMFVVGLRTPALAGLTLLTMYLVPVSVAPDATAWFWFILPAVSYLWLLADDNLRRVSAFGHRFTGSGQLVSQRFPSPMARTARWSAVGFIVVTLVSLTVVPTNTSGFIDRVAEDFEGGGDAGLGDVNPWAQLSGSLNRPEEVDVLRVSTDDPNPRYMRMHVLDELTSDGFGPNDYEGEDSLGDLGSGGEVYTAEVENLALEAPVLPVYGNPASVDVDGDWAVDEDTGVIIGDGSDMGDVESYSFSFTDPAPDAATLANAGGMDPGDARWQDNTRHPNVPEMTEIVDRELGDATTVHEKVLATLDYLSVANGFRYSLQTTDAGNEEAILDFLESQQGYCQQYAAAMAWMLREADVAARVVIGMSQGRRDGSEWVLSSHDYHAWVEVYYEGPGWVTFDPTPSAGVPGAVTFPWATEPAPEDEQTQDPGATTDPSAAPSEAPSSAAPDATAGVETPTGGPTAHAGDAGPGGGLAFNPLWLPLLPLAALPFVPAVWRRLLRRSRLDPARLTAKTAWDEVLDLALDYGVGVSDSLTPRQAAGVLGQAAPGARDAATALGAAMARHRYSTQGVDPAGLADAVRDLHAELDKRAEPRRRYRAVFWPASLLARISAKQAEESARLARRSARATDRMRSAVRRPRRSNSRKDRSVTGRP
ncbi:transglutaminase TgpA family protein [Glycomyces tritici]|uniref:TransglutaminaseTgpA domain-containing protein n=1 Tax=Glycomyces tritici TaxID=2665176 RepID=A0ABT7YLB0_9ACTN|nr:transglutaminaseTgpA domain-containing protein [Glycomyces tritici]MDN3239386.1 transglutaminaseTgpA domain-containing protein [Glycomyces tritici]